MKIQLFKREGNDFTNEKTTGDINSNEMLPFGKVLRLCVRASGLIAVSNYPKHLSDY